MAGDNTVSLTASSSSSKTTRSTAQKGLKGLGDLIRVLPSGTVFLYQFLNPLVTAKGHCRAANRFLSAALLLLCGLACCFASFTDSYAGTDGKHYYGVATRTGLWLFFDDPNSAGADLSKYRLRAGDFVHAVLAAAVFAALSLLDSDTVACFYAALEERQKVVAMVVPPVLGAVASAVFMAFPNTRHGIGYPSSSETATASDSTDA